MSKSIMPNDFCIFILTHGRADNVITYKALQKVGYKGKLYFVIDDEDKQRDKYIENFSKDKVLIFNKDEIKKSFDLADQEPNNKTIVYARNVCFELAKKLNIKYFLQFDDDYTDFNFRFNKDGYNFKSIAYDVEKVFLAILNFYKKTKFTSIAFAQGGDFIGGENSSFAKAIKLKRKAINSFFCSIDREFRFVGRINEDVNTYSWGQANKGYLFGTINYISLQQKQTQTNKGGMTDVYLDGGTYLKSFYSIIFHPSGCKIATMGNKQKRIHHKVVAKYTYPKILSEKYKK